MYCLVLQHGNLPNVYPSLQEYLLSGLRPSAHGCGSETKSARATAFQMRRQGCRGNQAEEAYDVMYSSVLDMIVGSIYTGPMKV